MKIAIETLNRYLKKQRSAEQLVELMNQTEIEVEEVLQGHVLDQKIILAKTIDVAPHPDADRLRLVTVTTGTKKVQVVCGAPNVAVEQRVVLVQPGAVLLDGTKIVASKIRGVESHGMLASSQELGLSEDHSGILVLENDSHKLGTSLCDIVFSRTVLDIKTPANRWDYLSGVGMARELAAHDTREQGVVEPAIGQYDYKKTEFVNVKEVGKCPRFISANVRIRNDVKSPAWLVDNLEANGFVSHNAVVDITNFVMLETGQPSHAYDLAKLSGPLAVRLAESGEKITTLDDEQRSLSNEDLVVADEAGAVGLAGIMGSAHTQIDEHTTEILLEAANFDKATVRRSAVRHGLRTEASARFERGLPLPLSLWAFGRLLDLLREICDAEIIDGPFDQLYGWPWQQFLGVRLRTAERFLGMDLPETTVVQGLRKLGFGVEHFSLTKELKSHLGKPYKWGANYRADGEEAFDCSYLVDRIYSKLGVFVGHTALGQFHTGRPVEASQLKPGDVLFIEGIIEKSSTDHYYLMAPDGKKVKHTLKQPMKVGHNGIYLGGGQVIHAATYKHRDGKWVKRRETGVVVSPVEEFTQDPGYLGARRYLESFNHILAIEVPWWRSDIRLETDVFEEIAKLVGYENMPETLPGLPPMPAHTQSSLPEQMRLRQQLIAAGGTEIATYSFISQADAETTGQSTEALPKIANPRTPEQTYLRSTLLSSHLHVWERNGQSRLQHITFEMSRVFHGHGRQGELPDEQWRLGMSTAGEDALERLQAFIHRLAALRHWPLEFHPTTDQNLVGQRAVDIHLDDRRIGEFGQVKAAVASSFGLSQTVAWCELELEPLMSLGRKQAVEPVPEYQLIIRDVSLEIDQAVHWQMIERVLRRQKAVFSVEFLSTFTDAKLNQAGRRVVSCRLRLDAGPQPSAEKITQLIERCYAALKHSLPDEAELSVR